VHFTDALTVHVREHAKIAHRLSNVARRLGVAPGRHLTELGELRILVGVDRRAGRWGFKVSGVGLQVQGVGCRIEGVGPGGEGLGVEDFRVQIQDFEFRALMVLGVELFSKERKCVSGRRSGVSACYCPGLE